MALDKSLKKVLILGSGPIIIGQAAEFDYSGTQACTAVREEGIEVVLVNSNPATIMTDTEIADKVYIEPLDVESIEEIIKKERPEGIMAGFGGQTALNLAMKLKEQGVLDKFQVKLLGINSDAIKKSEDREEFKKLMLETGQPIPESIIATNVDECKEFVENHGFPVIIRPAYTLGGTGGGIASNIEELIEICSRGINMSPINQILLEQSVAGWKEIEYEVIRDKKDNCIIVCNMENMDPVGIHTGDSIVVAPSQTLRDKEYQMLRKASTDIVRSLKIEGGCNVQLALNPNDNRYVVIEVNPRVSRSSALASKATGYPIAKIASKIALGYSLDELKNPVTGNSSACFEPAIDYVVTKIPRWPFDKFERADRKLGTQMKATGEVMALARSFEASLMKAVASLDGNINSLLVDEIMRLSLDEIKDGIRCQDDRRLFFIAEAIRRDMSLIEINEITKIDMWFLNGINNIINMERKLQREGLNIYDLKEAKKLGFSDKDISKILDLSEEYIEEIRKENNIMPSYKIVDTCSGEFEATTPYYYSTYDEEDENIISNERKILIVGSGPIRIGQGIEFDYCSVHGIWAVKKNGYSPIIINSNPETVSTDFDTADKLYFEPITIENVVNIIEKEKIEGVILEFGGQTSINLAKELHRRGIKIFGTSFESIDIAEDRDKFGKFLKSLDIYAPEGKCARTREEAIAAAEELGYPLVLRPSYVIGGRAMEIIHNNEGLLKYITDAVKVTKEHPILIDRYIMGKEIEVDALCDGEEILIPGIMEHIERTGVHSGDSITVYPPVSLSKEVIDTLVHHTKQIAVGLNIKGLVNIQYAFDGERVYVIEVNPRASRTVPILSKVTKVPMIDISLEIKLGKSLKESNYGTGILPNKNYYAVKAPVFSGEKLNNADIYLGPEMKSTGEVLGIDEDYNKAVYKAFKSTGINLNGNNHIHVSLNEFEKNQETLEILKRYTNLGFSIMASEGTARFLNSNGIYSTEASVKEIVDHIRKNEISLVINTPNKGNDSSREGFKLRSICTACKIPLFTCLDTAKIFADSYITKK